MAIDLRGAIIAPLINRKKRIIVPLDLWKKYLKVILDKGNGLRC